MPSTRDIEEMFRRIIREDVEVGKKTGGLIPVSGFPVTLPTDEQLFGKGEALGEEAGVAFLQRRFPG